MAAAARTAAALLIIPSISAASKLPGSARILAGAGPMEWCLSCKIRRRDWRPWARRAEHWGIGNFDRDQAGIASGRGAWHPVRQRHLGRHAIGDDTAAVAGPFWAATEISPRCELPQPGAVGTHDIDIRQLQPLPSSVSEWHRIVAAGGEGNPLPVRRPRRTKVAAPPRCELFGAQRGEIHRPKVRRPPSRADEHELLTVGRECRLIVVSGILGELCETGAIRFYAIKLRRAVPFRSEDDGFVVGCPNRVVVCVLRVEQGMLISTVGCCHEQS